MSMKVKHSWWKRLWKDLTLFKYEEASIKCLEAYFSLRRAPIFMLISHLASDLSQMVIFGGAMKGESGKIRKYVPTSQNQF